MLSRKLDPAKRPSLVDIGQGLIPNNWLMDLYGMADQVRKRHGRMKSAVADLKSKLNVPPSCLTWWRATCSRRSTPTCSRRALSRCRYSHMYSNSSKDKHDQALMSKDNELEAGCLLVCVCDYYTYKSTYKQLGPRQGPPRYAYDVVSVAVGLPLFLRPSSNPSCQSYIEMIA